MIRTIFWVFVFVLALSFFGISIRAIVMSPAGQDNFVYLFHLLIQAWQWIVGIVASIFYTLTHLWA
ncbi:MAG: hypothetical protein AAB442_02005 [Patescibacteria group bacterium]